MIANYVKKMYNILVNEREVESMSLKPFSSQISIFLSDGIMNPSRYVDEINDNFNGIFTKQNYSLNIEDAPSDVPLVRYSSKDGKYIYDFAKKRINFYLNFNEDDSVSLFENYKQNVEKLVKNIILRHSNISRVGLAINYYIDKKDDKHIYWVNKYKLPFYNYEKTSEISYTINNNFINKGLKYNNIMILSNAKYKNTKVVPVVSIDVNNLPTAKLSDESIEFIFHDIDNYKQDVIEGILNN